MKKLALVCMMVVMHKQSLCMRHKLHGPWHRTAQRSFQMRRVNSKTNLLGLSPASADDIDQALQADNPNMYLAKMRLRKAQLEPDQEQKEKKTAECCGLWSMLMRICGSSNLQHDSQ